MSYGKVKMKMKKECPFCHDDTPIWDIDKEILACKCGCSAIKVERKDDIPIKEIYERWESMIDNLPEGQEYRINEDDEGESKHVMVGAFIQSVRREIEEKVEVYEAIRQIAYRKVRTEPIDNSSLYAFIHAPTGERVCVLNRLPCASPCCYRCLLPNMQRKSASTFSDAVFEKYNDLSDTGEDKDGNGTD